MLLSYLLLNSKENDMKFKTLLITLPFIIAQTAFALNTKEAPEACPSVKAIQAEGVNHVVKENSRGGWIAFSSNNQYGTKEVWKFGISLDCHCDNEQDYLKASKEALNAFEPYVLGPEKSDDGTHWYCIYVAEGVIGQALTPPDELNLKQFKSRFKK